MTDPVLGDGAATYTPGVSRHRSSATTFENEDYLGTSTRQTNSSQTTTATRSYDAFGNLVSTTGTPVGPFGFVGKEGYQEDGDSGLKLLGHRYYDPSTGRFLTRDSEMDGCNWYQYVGANPLRDTDSSGLDAEHRGGNDWDKHSKRRAGGPEKKDPRMNPKKVRNPPTQRPDGIPVAGDPGFIGPMPAPKPNPWLIIGIGIVVIAGEIVVPEVTTPILIGVAAAG